MAKDRHPLTPSAPHDRLTAEQAAAAIVNLINSQPHSPRQADIAAIVARAVADPMKPMPVPAQSVSPLVLKIRAAIGLADAAEQADCEVASHDIEDEARSTALVEQRNAELYELVAQFPDPPCSPEHGLIRAEVAYHFADKDAEGRLIFNDDDCTAGPAARLIKAIL